MHPTLPSVLVIGEEDQDSGALSALLRQGVRRENASTHAAALAALERRHFDLVIADLDLARSPALELVGKLVERWPDLPVIVTASDPTVESAVAAMRAGAADLLQKPFQAEEVSFVIQKSLTSVERRLEMPPPSSRDVLQGSSSAMAEVQELLRRAAPGTTTI